MATGIDRRRVGVVDILTLNRPPANAIDLALMEKIGEVFAAIADDQSVRAVVLTGAGSAFCAGLDLKAVPGYGKADQRRLLNALNRSILGAYDCPVPVIGAINGHAIAGGLVLALCCDWRIVADVPLQAGLTEVRAGIPYPIAAIEVVRSELSPQIARRLVLFGENLTGAEALAAGVFDECAAPHKLIDRALEKAAACADLPGPAFAQIKHQLRRPVIDACASVIAGGRDPLSEGWLSSETLAAASSILSGAARRKGG
ncbi:MAG: enoyl-CoA hydratase/isomerase family protein [Candidatus Binataceae bacterium]